jgi:hypothetical protein
MEPGQLSSRALDRLEMLFDCDVQKQLLTMEKNDKAA